MIDKIPGCYHNSGFKIDVPHILRIFISRTGGVLLLLLFEINVLLMGPVSI